MLIDVVFFIHSKEHYHIMGLLTFLMLTVPCGMKSINTNKYLWNFRQILLVILGSILLY